MTLEEDLRRELVRAVDAARAHGARTFYDVLSCCEGADPRQVAEIYSIQGFDSEEGSPAVARRASSELAALFPASDPIACQWWYTLDAVGSLASRVFEISHPPKPVAFLGTPTVAYQYSRRFGEATVLEIDEHVVATLQGADRLQAVTYDVANPLDPGHIGKHSVVLVDPPWYGPVLRAFLHRAVDLAEDGGSVLCSLPPRLTRPGIVKERQDLLKALLEAGLEVVGIAPSATRYLVPEFERVAFLDLRQFDGRPWRSGDLLHVRKKAGTSFPSESISAYNTRAFARNPRHYRVFLRTSCAPDPNLRDWVYRERAFEMTVSRRAIDPSSLHWWTSDKRGGVLRDLGLVKEALDTWQSGNDLEATVNALVASGTTRDSARGLCRDLDENLALWAMHGGAVTPSAGIIMRLTRANVAVTSTQGRPYPKSVEDGYREAFQRDRDRITWSRGLRQLANKTQVFPLASDDFLRNRLSHSLEVMQLATTIGASFKLNQSLTEAGALAHDIGHTPFGHAGEHALDQLFKEIKSTLGFNHYEHGVDVIRWLEDAYQSPALGGLPGLNITPEVAECIFKHTYCQSGDAFSQEELFKVSKHRTYFGGDLCHVEGQAVRIADKVSYLISDLEDGIRVGVFQLEDLVGCRLLRRPPIDLVPAPGESLHERFLSQRGLIVSLLMQDIIEATDMRLARLSTLEDVRAQQEYAVDHSAEIKLEVGEIWDKLQVGKLHQDARVRVANLRAARIIRELTLLFAVAPQLVDGRFREGHRRLNNTEYMDFYRTNTGRTVAFDHGTLDFIVRDGGRALGFDPRVRPEIPTEQLIQAKDYVAGISDARARAFHHEYLGT